MKLPFLKSKGDDSARKIADLRFKAEPLAAAIQGEVLDSYVVDQATVSIVNRDGRGLYVISEPQLSLEEQRFYSLLMESLFYSLKPMARLEDPLKYVEGFLWEAAEDIGIVNAVREGFQKYRYYIARDAFSYGPVHVPMSDPDIEEISCTGYGKSVTVIHRRFTEYDWLDTNITFRSEDELRNYVQRLSQRAGKSVTVAIPFTDAMSREGHRLAVTFADEVTLPGSTFCIRKFPESPLSMAHLLRLGTLTPLLAAYFWLLVEYRGFIMVLGPMGSGKTTLGNALLTMISPSLKISTIEDTPELRLPHPSWQRFKARHTYSITEARYDVNLQDLVKLSLRYRPDYIVVGEVRGEEIRALTQAAALGHGCVCLPRDEFVGFMAGENFVFSTMEQLVEGVLNNRLKDVKVFSLNQADWKLTPSEVKKVFKVPSCGFVEKIRLEGGKSFRVSPDHPVLVFTQGGVTAKLARNIQVGDYIPVPRKIPLHAKHALLDLVDLWRENRKIYVEPSRDVLKALDDRKVRQALHNTGYSYCNIHDWRKRRSGMPLSAYLRIEERHGSKLWRHSLKLKWGAKSKHYNSIPAVLSLDENFGGIIGYYLSEGNPTAGDSTLAFHFGPDERDLVDDLSKSLKKIGLRHILRMKKSSIDVIVYSKLFTHTLLNLGVGKGAENKRVPNITFQAPEAFSKALIKTYWNGNGSTVKHGKDSVSCSSTTVSRELAVSLVWLLKTLEIDSSVSEAEENDGGSIGGRRLKGDGCYVTKIAGGTSLKKFAEIIGVNPQTSQSFADMLPAFLLNKGRNKVWFTADNEQVRKKVKREFSNLLKGDAYFLRVAEKTEEPYEGWLYDVETEYENFLHSTCVLTHNCTLHAESPEAALVRMRSPPMDVQEGGLMLIWCFTLLNRVKTAEGKVVRRVLEATEVEPKDGRLTLRNVFTWDARTDTFTPATAEEVAKRSYRLKTVMRLTGWTEDELAEEINRRAEYLEETVKGGKLSYPDFSDAVGRFYISGRRSKD